MSIFYSKATAPTDIYTLSLHDALPIFTTNALARCVQDSVSSYNLWEDKDVTPLGTGNRNQVGVQVSGGSDAVRYFVSSEWERELGVLQMPAIFEQRILATRGISEVSGDR